MPKAKKTPDKPSKSKDEQVFAKQRAERGFSDKDVWGMSYWFLETVPQMLKQLKKERHGYPGFAPDGSPMTDKQWGIIIKRMLFLLKEMNEETCSLKNPYTDEWSLLWQEFDKKYPDKDVLKTDKEREDEKNGAGYPWIQPDRDPDRGGHYEEVSRKMREWEVFICGYRNKCKKEFFQLFSDYFWDLGD